MLIIVSKYYHFQLMNSPWFVLIFGLGISPVLLESGIFVVPLVRRDPICPQLILMFGPLAKIVCLLFTLLLYLHYSSRHGLNKLNGPLTHIHIIIMKALRAMKRLPKESNTWSSME